MAASPSSWVAAEAHRSGSGGSRSSDPPVPIARSAVCSTARGAPILHRPVVCTQARSSATTTPNADPLRRRKRTQREQSHRSQQCRARGPGGLWAGGAVDVHGRGQSDPGLYLQPAPVGRQVGQGRIGHPGQHEAERQAQRRRSAEDGHRGVPRPQLPRRGLPGSRMRRIPPTAAASTTRSSRPAPRANGSGS